MKPIYVLLLIPVFVSLAVSVFICFKAMFANPPRTYDKSFFMAQHYRQSWWLGFRGLNYLVYICYLTYVVGTCRGDSDIVTVIARLFR